MPLYHSCRRKSTYLMLFQDLGKVPNRNPSRVIRGARRHSSWHDARTRHHEERQRRSDLHSRKRGRLSLGILGTGCRLQTALPPRRNGADGSHYWCCWSLRDSNRAQWGSAACSQIPQNRVDTRIPLCYNAHAKENQQALMVWSRLPRPFARAFSIWSTANLEARDAG